YSVLVLGRSPSSLCHVVLLLFFFTATSTTQLYTLSLHDALPIYFVPVPSVSLSAQARREDPTVQHDSALFRLAPCRGLLSFAVRSEEHTSELQSRSDLVCRLLLEKKKNYLLSLILSPFTPSHSHD